VTGRVVQDLARCRSGSVGFPWGVGELPWPSPGPGSSPGGLAARPVRERCRDGGRDRRKRT